VRPRIQEAVNQLLNRQGPDGSFGLWREQDGGATAWLGAYVTDFLYRAKADGYGVPDEALEKSYRALGQIARIDRWVYSGYQMQAYEGPWSNDTTDQLRRRSAAYAYYVLARAGSLRPTLFPRRTHERYGEPARQGACRRGAGADGRPCAVAERL
jgi:hypothetical protein